MNLNKGEEEKERKLCKCDYYSEGIEETNSIFCDMCMDEDIYFTCKHGTEGMSNHFDGLFAIKDKDGRRGDE